MKMYILSVTIFIEVVLIFTSSITPFVNGQVNYRNQHNVHEVVENNLLVVLLTYDYYCVGQNDEAISEFGNAAKIAQENGLIKSLNMQFVQVNVRDECGRECVFKMTCIAPPKIKLYRYGKEIEYGGKIVISDLFKWLEKNTAPAVATIQDENELKSFVFGNEFSVLGYFKNDSKTRFVFWKVADKWKDYTWADVSWDLKPSDIENDTIVVTQKVQYGSQNVTLTGEENFNDTRIEKFARTNANSTGPIIDLKNDQYLKEIIKNHPQVAIAFYKNECSPPQNVPEYFETTAGTAFQNGMAAYVKMRFAKVSIPEVSRETLTKYDISTSCDFNKHWRSMRQIRFVKYGQMIKYPDNGMWSQTTSTVKGFTEWLEKNTKPPTKIITSEDELRIFVDYTEVTIVGYFKQQSIARTAFWKVAEKLDKYQWGDVDINFLRIYDEDTIIINQEYGVSRLMMNDTFTEENIENFVKQYANSTYPVPTRAIPTLRPDLDPALDLTHYQQQLAFIYTLPFFNGQEHKLEVGLQGCMNLTGEMEQVAQSIKTFGQCFIIYEMFGCNTTSLDDHIRLDNSNLLIQHDLAVLAFHKLVRSIELCSNFDEREATLAKMASSAGLHNQQMEYIFGLLMLITRAFFSKIIA